MSNNEDRIREAVGDTSLINEKDGGLTKKRRIKMWGFIAGIALLIILSCIIFTTPIKADFRFQDGATKTERYEISRTSGLLDNGPQDPKRSYYNFGGWYLNDSYTIGPLFNNKDDKSLLEYKFSVKSGNILLYAKWDPVEYQVTYDLKGNINKISENSLNSIINNNLTYYTAKHTASQAELNAYADKLRAEYPELYVNNKDAEKNLTKELDLYKNNCQLAERKLFDIELSGYTFLGWYDENGNKVEVLNQLDPKDITLIAQWEKN